MNSTSWQSYEKVAAKANRRNKTSVFEALSKAGITRVSVEFDGEGDERQMDCAVAQIKGETVAFPDTVVTVQMSRWGSANVTTTGMELQVAVEHVCYGYLEEKCSGWEINEGSFGKFVFDVRKRTLTLDRYVRIVESNHSRHKL